MKKKLKSSSTPPGITVVEWMMLCQHGSLLVGGLSFLLEQGSQTILEHPCSLVIIIVSTESICTLLDVDHLNGNVSPFTQNTDEQTP